MKYQRSNKMGQKLIPCVPIYRFAFCDSSSKQLQVPINNFTVFLKSHREYFYVQLTQLVVDGHFVCSYYADSKQFTMSNPADGTLVKECIQIAALFKERMIFFTFKGRELCIILYIYIVLPVALLIPWSIVFSTFPRRIESTVMFDFSSLAVTATGSIKDLWQDENSQLLPQKNIIDGWSKAT